MKKIILAAFITLSASVSAVAQSGYTAVKNTQQVKDKFSQTLKTTNSIQSSFKQTKEMKLLKENIVSTGMFYYKKENKIRIEYQKPYTYLVILNNGQMSITDNYGKKTNIKTSNSKSMKAMNGIMIDCMNGNIFNNKDFKSQINENSKEYSIVLTPMTSEMKSMYQQINVFFDKSQLKIQKLVLKELNGDITTMNYSQTQTNVNINDQLFKNK